MSEGRLVACMWNRWRELRITKSQRCYQGSSVVKNTPAIAEDSEDMGSVPWSGWSPEISNGNPLQYAWKIPLTEEPGGLQSMGLQSVRQQWACTHTIASHRHVLYNRSSMFNNIAILPMRIDGYKTYLGDNCIIYANVKALCSTPEINNIVCQLYFFF